MTLQTYTFYWYDGKREVLQGYSPTDALTRNYSDVDLATFAFWAPGDDTSYVWWAEKRVWCKADKTEAQP